MKDRSVAWSGLFLSVGSGLHFLDLELLDVSVHSVKRIQLQGFVEGVGRFQLHLRGYASLDKRV